MATLPCRYNVTFVKRCILFLSISMCCCNNVSGSISIPWSIEKAMEKYIATMQSTVYDKKPMDKVSLLCKNDVTKLVMRKFPSAETQWKHNGDTFVLKPERMSYSIDSITVQNLIPPDSGIYQCDIYLNSDQYLTVAVFSVVVGDELVSIYLGDDIEMNCNSAPLGKLFPKATRQWKHGEKKLLSKSATDESLDSFPSSSGSSTGVWTCETRDPDTDRTWLTARYKVAVKPPLSLMQKIRRYSKTNKIETLVIIGALCFGTVSVINLLTTLLNKRKESKNKEMEFIKQRLGLDGAIPDTTPLLSSDSSSDSDSSSTDQSDTVLM